ncbi:MAG: hypothetical protein KJ737_25790 [Proteobacteria bacterium]|nr:hypothetical protein [Pseudomonadota bacterium]
MTIPHEGAEKSIPEKPKSQGGQPGLFSLASGQGLDLNPETASFYIGRENLILADPSSMARWRANLFIFMSRNAADAASFFNLPADQTIEVGVQLEI